MSEMDEARRIPGDQVLGPIQLQDAYLYDVTVSRESAPRDDGDERPILEPKVRGWTLSEDRLSLLVVLGATVRHRFRAEASVHMDISVAGHFVSREQIADETAQAFSPVNGLVLLWPYLRGYTSTISAAMQVDLPTLPVLDTASVLDRMAVQVVPRDERAPVAREDHP